MTRTCTVCAHPERTAIDAALLAQQPLRDLARQYHVSKDALARHREHLADELRRHHQANLESAAIVKRLELERLDELWQKYWPTRERITTARFLLKLMERRARLEGLDTRTALRHVAEPANPIKVQARFTVAESPNDLLSTVNALEMAGVVPVGTESALHAALVAMRPDVVSPATELLGAPGRDKESTSQ